MSAVKGKKLLVLGAGPAQLDLIRYCRENEMESYCVSYRADSSAAEADHFALIDITDRESILHYAAKNRVDAVYSTGSDYAVPVIAAVSEQLGLPHFVSLKTAETCCDKSLMRKALGESRYNIPCFTCSSAEDIPQELSFPMICKPADSQGQRGVFYARNRQELLERLQESLSHSRTGRVILEPFLEGREVSVNAFFCSGEMRCFVLTDRETLPGYTGIVCGHRIPSVYSGTPIEIELKSLVRESAQKLGIAEGPAYFQIIVSHGGPYVIEAAPRLDGCHLWKLIRFSSGIDFLDMTVRSLFGKPYTVEKRSDQSICHCRLSFFTTPPETIFQLPDDMGESMETVLYYRPGETVHTINGHMEKCGYRITDVPGFTGVIGGSGILGKAFQRLYGEKFEAKELSRSSGTIADYSEESLFAALEGCVAVVLSAGIKASDGDSMAIQSENISITENTLKACRRRRIRNIVYLSSRCVYGTDSPMPVSEETILSPINAYGISKAAGEMLCLLENSKYHSCCKVLRLAQIVAPGQNNLSSVFLENATRGKPLPIYGEGRGGRDYLAPEDAAAAIACTLRKPELAGVFNIGMAPGEMAVSPVRMAQAARAAFQNDSDIVFLPDKPDDPTVFRMDTRKAERELGFTARYSIEEVFRLYAGRKENNE